VCVVIVRVTLHLLCYSECQLSRQTLRKTSSAKEPMRTRGIARMWKAEKHSDRLLSVSYFYLLHCVTDHMSEISIGGILLLLVGSSETRLAGTV